MARNVKIDLVLVRSGRTEWDERGRIQGRTDLPLSATGRAEAAATALHLAGTLAGLPKPLVHAAPDEASIETATLIADRLNVRPRVLDGLQTMDLGLWEGLLESEIEARFPSASRLWSEQPSLVAAPRGEEFEEADLRFRRTVCEILERPPSRTVVFVSRPLPFAMGCCWLAGRPPRDVWAVLSEPDSIRSFSLAVDHVRTLVEEMKAGA
jgi:probable phosphoglycerate mutase